MVAVLGVTVMEVMVGPVGVGVGAGVLEPLPPQAVSSRLSLPAIKTDAIQPMFLMPELLNAALPIVIRPFLRQNVATYVRGNPTTAVSPAA
jgi:hypothetical protein